jgi:hypothetical protein
VAKHRAATEAGRGRAAVVAMLVPPNKAMKLTRLAAAPGRMRQGAAAWPRRRGSAATASQLIAGVLRTRWSQMHRNGLMAAPGRWNRRGGVWSAEAVATARPRPSASGAWRSLGSCWSRRRQMTRSGLGTGASADLARHGQFESAAQGVGVRSGVLHGRQRGRPSLAAVAWS